MCCWGFGDCRKVSLLLLCFFSMVVEAGFDPTCARYESAPASGCLSVKVCRCHRRRDYLRLRAWHSSWRTPRTASGAHPSQWTTKRHSCAAHHKSTFVLHRVSAMGTARTCPEIEVVSRVITQLTSTLAGDRNFSSHGWLSSRTKQICATQIRRICKRDESRRMCKPKHQESRRVKPGQI